MLDIFNALKDNKINFIHPLSILDNPLIETSHGFFQS